MPGDLTVQTLKAELTLDVKTGYFTRNIPTTSERIGAIAGNVGANGRRMISVNGARYMASHLVWLWVHGRMPTGYVKQRNGNYDDTRPDNLYEESPRDSAMNARLRANNRSGHKGVSWNAERQRWVATLRVGGKLVNLGRFNEKEDAIAARKRAEDEMIRTGGVAEVKADSRAAAMQSRLSRLWRKVVLANGGSTGWAGFDEFAAEIGTMPKGQRGVEPADPSQVIGPGNWRFVTKFDRRTPGGRAAYLRDRRQRDPDQFKNNELKKSFGITIERYREMLAEQDGKCAACGCTETQTLGGKTKQLAVDHCHHTQAVRGLLCARCNTSMGQLNDDLEAIICLAIYRADHASADDLAKAHDAAVILMSAMRERAGALKFSAAVDPAVVSLVRKESA